MRCAHRDCDFTPKNSRGRFCSSRFRAAAWQRKREGRETRMRELVKGLVKVAGLTKDKGLRRKPQALSVSVQWTSSEANVSSPISETDIETLPGATLFGWFPLQPSREWYRSKFCSPTCRRYIIVCESICSRRSRLRTLWHSVTFRHCDLPFGLVHLHLASVSKCACPMNLRRRILGPAIVRSSRCELRMARSEPAHLS
jgi:hypothetical protein